MSRARTDALRDMILEGELTIEDLMRNCKMVKTYYGSCSIYNADTETTETGPCRIEANSLEEAYGIAYLEMKDRHEGVDWLPPDITILEEPVWRIDDLSLVVD